MVPDNDINGILKSLRVRRELTEDSNLHHYFELEFAPKKSPGEKFINRQWEPFLIVSGKEKETIKRIVSYLQSKGVIFDESIDDYKSSGEPRYFGYHLFFKSPYHEYISIRVVSFPQLKSYHNIFGRVW